MSDITGKIARFEYGLLDGAGVLELFQELVDSGMAWELQGSYGRMARELLRNGLIDAPNGAGLEG